MDVGGRGCRARRGPRARPSPAAPGRARTIERTATQPSRCSGETVGLSMPGVSATACSTRLDADVVVHHHVGRAPPGRPRAGAGTRRSRPAARPPARVISTASDSRIGSPKTSSPALRSVLPVSTTSAITSATPSCTLVSTAPSSRVTVASTPCSSRCRRTTPAYDVAIRLPARSLDAGEPCRAGRRSGTASGRSRACSTSSALAPESSSRSRPVMPDVEGALADVQRDVAGAQVEELDAVLAVGEGQLLGVGALLVAGLAQDVGGRLGQRALVGDRQPQQPVGQLVGHGRLVPAQRWA